MGYLSTNDAQIECAESFVSLASRIKALQKHINEVHKLTLRVIELAEKKLEARKSDAWKTKEIRQERDRLDVAHDDAMKAIKATLYFNHQGHWLQSDFPEAVMVDVAGLCKIVKLVRKLPRVIAV